MACTSVYEDYVTPSNELYNMNTTFMRQAIQTCVKISDFDSFIKTWPNSNSGKAISGNYVAIDAYGGACLYELYTGSAQVQNNGIPHIYVRKCDANTGKITDEYGNAATTAITGGSSSSFPGWFNRTNSHNWISTNAGRNDSSGAQPSWGRHSHRPQHHDHDRQGHQRQTAQ